MNVLVWSLPVVSGLADGLYRGAIKLSQVHRFLLLAGSYLFALPFYLPLLAAEGIPEVKPAFWLVLAAHVPLLVVAQILTVEAHRISPLALTAPYLALTTVWLLVTSPLMRSGTPTVWGAGGVIAVTLGLYFLNVRDGQRNLLDPFRQLQQERGSVLMFIVSIIFAITANLDYLAFQNANASFYLVVDHGIVGAVCGLLALGYWTFGRVSTKELRPYRWWSLPLCGLVIAVSVVPHMLAFWWIPNVPYVIAGKRAGVVFFSVAIGIAISLMPRFGDRYIEERTNLNWRLPGVALVLAGMLAIIFWGKTV